MINSITVCKTKTEVTRIFHVVDSMLYARVGNVITINVTRNGETMDFTVPVTAEMLKNWRMPS